VGLRNDVTYRTDPEHAADNRWIHRPRMDWVAASRRHDVGSVEARIFGDLRHLIDVRRATPQFHAATPLEVVDLGDPSVFAFVRRHPQGTLLAIHGFADAVRAVSVGGVFGATAGTCTDLLDPAALVGPDVTIPARGVRWLVESGARA
jgi:amylosucrase